MGPHAIARHGNAALVVECRRGVPGEICRGTVGLHALLPGGTGGFYVGKARFEIPAGKRTTVWVPLTEGAKIILANKGKLTADVFSEILVGVSEVKVRIVAADGRGEVSQASAAPPNTSV